MDKFSRLAAAMYRERLDNEEKGWWWCANEALLGPALQCVQCVNDTSTLAVLPLMVGAMGPIETERTIPRVF